MAAIYSTFLQRAYDQVVHDVCLQNLDVTFALDRAGVVGADGATHQGFYDYGYLRILPEHRGDGAQGRERAAATCCEPRSSIPGRRRFAIRAGTASAFRMDPEIKALPVGEAELLRDGDDVLILAVGNAGPSRPRGGRTSWRPRASTPPW